MFFQHFGAYEQYAILLYSHSMKIKFYLPSLNIWKLLYQKWLILRVFLNKLFFDLFDVISSSVKDRQKCAVWFLIVLLLQEELRISSVFSVGGGNTFTSPTSEWICFNISGDVLYAML